MQLVALRPTNRDTYTDTNLDTYQDTNLGTNLLGDAGDSAVASATG